jgi:hypothetical protein
MCEICLVYYQSLGYCWISKQMSSLYFGLDVFSQSEASVPEFETVCSVECTLYSPQLLGGRGCLLNSGTLASNRQNRASPKYNDDIALLISQYFMFVYYSLLIIYHWNFNAPVACMYPIRRPGSVRSSLVRQRRPGSRPVPGERPEVHLHRGGEAPSSSFISTCHQLLIPWS